jgi:hypothetical protein
VRACACGRACMIAAVDGWKDVYVNFEFVAIADSTSLET